LQWPGHSRPKDGVALLAYGRPKDGVALLAYGRPKDGVASLAYVARPFALGRTEGWGSGPVC
jgi:hypothetical protein